MIWCGRICSISLCSVTQVLFPLYRLKCLCHCLLWFKNSQNKGSFPLDNDLRIFIMMFGSVASSLLNAFKMQFSIFYDCTTYKLSLSDMEQDRIGQFCRNVLEMQRFGTCGMSCFYSAAEQSTLCISSHTSLSHLAVDVCHYRQNSRCYLSPAKNLT